MNDSSSEIDATLLERFRREHTHVPAEPFVSATLRRVEAERARATAFRYALQAAVSIAVILASPWLINASALMSEELEGLFAKASALLGTPLGMLAAALGVTISAALLRPRTHR